MAGERERLAEDVQLLEAVLGQVQGRQLQDDVEKLRDGVLSALHNGDRHGDGS